MKHRLRNTDNGDTIVEVLISLAVITSVLWGGYYTANQSFRADRDSQEHSQALTVAQAQVEALRSVYTSFNPATDQCIDNTLTPTAKCYVDGNNTASFSLTCTSTSYCYKVFIAAPTTTNVPIKPGVNAMLTTYKVDVSWHALSGGMDDVSLYYRVD